MPHVAHVAHSKCISASIIFYNDPSPNPALHVSISVLYLLISALHVSMSTCVHCMVKNSGFESQPPSKCHGPNRNLAWMRIGRPHLAGWGSSRSGVRVHVAFKRGGFCASASAVWGALRFRLQCGPQSAGACGNGHWHDGIHTPPEHAHARPACCHARAMD